MNLSIEINNTEFLLDGYISSDNDGVNAAIFITIVPDTNGDFCLGAYYGYAGGGENDGGFFIIDIENSIHKHVNFDEFIFIAKEYNLKIETFCSQKDFLISCGIQERKKNLQKF